MGKSRMVRPIDILLVEDNPGDVDLTLEALEDSKVNNRLHVVDDGEKAMAFLRRETPYGNAPRPDLILLDLNLPRKDGREVLADVKNDEALKSIPVVILTSSAAEADVLRSYDLGANCYVSKPINLDRFLDVVRCIHDFWVSIVILPGNEKRP
jgi:two-component system, chemotaxis family, response regulator Rcp1